VTDVIREVVLGSFWLMLPGLGPVIPLSRKNGILDTFFGRQPTKVLKIGTCIF